MWQNAMVLLIHSGYYIKILFYDLFTVLLPLGFQEARTQMKIG